MKIITEWSFQLTNRNKVYADSGEFRGNPDAQMCGDSKSFSVVEQCENLVSIKSPKVPPTL